MNAIRIIQAVNEYGYYCRRCQHKAKAFIVVTGFAHQRIEFCESCYDGRDGQVKEVE